MEIIDTKIIFLGNVAEGTNIASFCGLTKMADATLVATARLGSGKDSADGNAAFWVSKDNGATWSRPNMPFSTSFNGKKGCLRGGYISELNDGTWLFTLGWVDRSVQGRPLYNKETGGLCPMFPLISCSLDKGETWSCLQKFDISPFELPAALTGPTLVLEDGSVAAQFEVQKNWDDISPVYNISILKFSHDDGKTWSDYVEIAGKQLKGKVCWDQRIAVISPNRMIALFWSYNPAQDCDLPIHSSFSDDNGRTWTFPHDTGITGQIACPVVLSKTDIVMLYVRRDKKKQILARRSYDGGKSWDEKSEICVYDHTNPHENGRIFFDAMNQWSYGHPFGIKTGENEISMVYYAQNAGNMALWFSKIEV